MHDLAYYRSISTPIPLWSIHAHWTRLSMHTTEFNEDGTRPDRTSQVVEILDGMDPSMGRPAGRDEQSTRRIPSFSEASTSGSRTATSRVRVRGRGRRGRDCYIQQLPQAYQRYVSHTVDVLGDGHCGFRAIAAQIEYSENDWRRVREELSEEIEQNFDLYRRVFPVHDWANRLLILLNWFGSTAP
ncbi:hypothetical protein RHMOL_Rhmol09G0093700 [Rhododendron molle]|uniref:Uncharacterized protein n=1 Tax=Rhododendron molle TaxID=49168 RepID=A0ACC0MBA3_RHOML|nr:hypothetical protein RHMOL_Rhmol09G0093700 [Rhododendron molle]